MKDRIKSLFHREKGFTFIELMISLALFGLITSTATFLIEHIMLGNLTSTARMTIIKELELSSHNFIRDTQMARSVTITPGTGFPLQMSMKDPDGNSFTVSYFVENGCLKRSDSRNDRVIILMHHLDTSADKTSVSYSSKLLTLKLTGTINQRSQIQESRTIQATLRLSSVSSP